MIKEENYPNAYKEVYVILQNIEKSDLELIPKSFIKMLERKMNPNYNFELHNKDFENENLLQETKAILAYLYLNYWGTEKEKARIKQKFRQDILREEQEKKQKYNANDLLKKKNESKKEEVELNKCKKENFFMKLINKIKNYFKNK